MKDNYRLTCRSCRYMRRWTEKEEWLREFYGPACCDACLCMHPERAHPVWVGRDDSPYRNDSTRNARMCPIKAREMGVSQ